MISFFEEVFYRIFPFMNPGSRLYILSLATCVFISLFFYKKKRFSLRESLHSFFSHEYVFSRSAIVDYKIIVINAFFKTFSYSFLFGVSYFFSKSTLKFMITTFGSPVDLSDNVSFIVLFSLVAFMWDDFLRFFHHFLMHKIPFLWELHKTHHSANVLTPATLYRIHPLESGIATLRNALSFGTISSVMMFFSGSGSLVLTVLGVNIFAFLFNISFGNLRHSHIPISFGFMENIFISPKQHQIHHSADPIHFDKNFGVALSFWDKLFGTYVRSKGQKVKSFGVDGVDPGSLSQQYLRARPPLLKETGGSGAEPIRA